jgi:chromosome segregation ATPase
MNAAHRQARQRRHTRSIERQIADKQRELQHEEKRVDPAKVRINTLRTEITVLNKRREAVLS